MHVHNYGINYVCSYSCNSSCNYLNSELNACLFILFRCSNIHHSKEFIFVCVMFLIHLPWVMRSSMASSTRALSESSLASSSSSWAGDSSSSIPVILLAKACREKHSLHTKSASQSHMFLWYERWCLRWSVPAAWHALAGKVSLLELVCELAAAPVHHSGSLLMQVWTAVCRLTAVSSSPWKNYNHLFQAMVWKKFN